MSKERSTPSTRMSGDPSPANVARPRMLICVSSDPGAPEVWVVITPLILPAMACDTLAAGEESSSLLDTCEMAPTTLSFFLCAVTYHYHFFQCFGVFGQSLLSASFLALLCLFLVFVAHIADDQHCLVAGYV